MVSFLVTAVIYSKNEKQTRYHGSVTRKVIALKGTQFDQIGKNLQHLWEGSLNYMPTMPVRFGFILLNLRLPGMKTERTSTEA